ncbi:MAG: hypothetical protein IH626_02365 [Rhodospirillales bacterium]|nr:hypothetical protein [Rhodospirillales bacterium]
MTAVRVYVATTDGPSEIQRIADEDPDVRSVVCLNGTSEALPISGGYDAFVRKPTGVVERLFGHPVFRMDVATRISGGHSWQLPVYAAHALRAAGQLAQRGAPATRVIWLTGTVDSDLRVGPVNHVAEKLRHSQPLFRKLRAEGVPVTVFVPKACADQIPTSEAGDGDDGLAGVEVVLVETAYAVCHNLGLSRIGHGVGKGRPRSGGGNRSRAVLTALIVLAVGMIGAVHWRAEVGTWLGSQPPTENRLNGGQTVAVVGPPAVTPVALGGMSTTVPAPGPSADSSLGFRTPDASTVPTTTPGSKSSAPASVAAVAQVASLPDAGMSPEAQHSPRLAAADVQVSAVEWRAPGGRSCAVAGFGSAGPAEMAIGTVVSGRFAVSSANGLCTAGYRAVNKFTAPVRIWLFAAPIGARKHFVATSSALETHVLGPDEATTVELKLPRWINEPVSHRIIVVATAEADGSSFGWLDQGMAAFGTSFDFGRWSDLRRRIQDNGMVLVSAVHEIIPQ